MARDVPVRGSGGEVEWETAFGVSAEWRCERDGSGGWGGIHAVNGERVFLGLLWKREGVFALGVQLLDCLKRKAHVRKVIK